MSDWSEAWLQEYEAMRASQRGPERPNPTSGKRAAEAEVGTTARECAGELVVTQLPAGERPARNPAADRVLQRTNGGGQGCHPAVLNGSAAPARASTPGGQPTGMAGDARNPRRTKQRSAARDPMLVMGDPPAVEEQNATGSDRRAVVALRTPGATGEPGLKRPTKPNKYGAVRTVAPASWGGTRLADSKAGARLSRTLETLKITGAILDYWEEVSLPIGVDGRGKVIRYRADAMVLLGYVDAPDSTEPAMVVRFIDAKSGSMDTRTSSAKRAALRNRGLNVEVRT